MHDLELCPRCKYISSRVLDVRYQNHIRRRKRECQSCGFRWFTVEIPELEWVHNIKLDEYQALAQRTSRKDICPDDHLMNAMLGLAGETGECCDLVKKCFFQDGREVRDKLTDELGDVLWYVAEAASALGLKLSDIAQYNVEKLRKRYPEGFSAQKSLNREE